MVVDSQQQMLDLPDLLQAAIEETPSDVPFDLVLASFFKELQMPDSIIYKYGNTIFVVHESEEQRGTGMFRALNADIAQNFLQSSYQWVQDAYADGLWLLVTEFDDPNLLHIFEIISRTPPNPDMGYTAEQLDDDTFRVILTLGTPPAGQQQPDMSMMQSDQTSMPQQGMLNQLGGA